MAATITFMRVTFRAAKDEVSSALAPKDGKGNALPVILNAVENHPNPIKTITGAGLTYLGTGRWRVSGNHAEVTRALELLNAAGTRK